MYSYSTPPRPQAQIPVRLCSGQASGAIVGHTYKKTVDSTRHFLQRPPAIALDQCVLDEITERGVNRIEIRDQFAGETYTCSLTTFTQKSFRFDRGHGVQWALPLAHWQTSTQTLAAAVAEIEAGADPLW